MTGPADDPLTVLADRLAAEPELVDDLLDDPAAWVRARALSEHQQARLGDLVTHRADALAPRHRRPLLAAAFALARHRADGQPSSDPSSSTSSSRDDTSSLR